MRNFLMLLLAILSIQAYAQERNIFEKPAVDKRVELLSIVFHLAERPEYSNNFKLYSDRIEDYFEEFKNHELIQFTKSIVANRGVGYDAVAWLAIYMNDNLELIKDVQQEVWQRDTRWTKESVEKFVPLLRQFAQDSKFDEFFKSNADLYADAVERMTPLSELLDLDWYSSFYGEETPVTFSIIIGLGNASNYGPSLNYIDGSRKLYSIVGVVKIDSAGMPKFDYNPLAFLVPIHEFNHSFVNYLIDNNKEALRESGERIFPAVQDVLSKQGYDRWEIMMYEALVRAAVIKYMKDHDFHPQMVEAFTQWEKECGFFWIEELIEELENYTRQRDKYPTLESYMPKIIEAYKIWAANSNT